MKNLLLSILKQSGGNVPDNVTTTSVELNDGGLIFIGVIIGVLIAFFAMGIFKSFKNTNKDENKDEDKKDKNQ